MIFQLQDQENIKPHPNTSFQIESTNHFLGEKFQINFHTDYHVIHIQ